MPDTKGSQNGQREVFFGREPMGGSMVRKNLTQGIPQGRPRTDRYQWGEITSINGRKYMVAGVINLYS